MQKQGTIETGFEPAVSGYKPLAKPFSYSNLLFVPFKTQFQIRAGCEPAILWFSARRPSVGANGSSRNCCLCLSIENAAQGSRQTSEPDRLMF